MTRDSSQNVPLNPFLQLHLNMPGKGDTQLPLIQGLLWHTSYLSVHFAPVKPGGQIHLVSVYDVCTHLILAGHGFCSHRLIVCSQNLPVSYGGQTHLNELRLSWTQTAVLDLHGFWEQRLISLSQLAPMTPVGQADIL